MLGSIIIGALTKFLASFGLGALTSWLDHLKSKDVQWTKRWIAAASAEVEIKKNSQQYRIALLNTKIGAVLVLLIVGAPALHWALVWGDTIWLSFSGWKWGIEEAPAEYARLGRDIMLTFIGVKGAVGLSDIVMRGIGRK